MKMGKIKTRMILICVGEVTGRKIDFQERKVNAMRWFEFIVIVIRIVLNSMGKWVRKIGNF